MGRILTRNTDIEQTLWTKLSNTNYKNINKIPKIILNDC